MDKDKLSRRELMKKLGQTGLALAGMELLSGLPLGQEENEALAAGKQSVVAVASKGTVAQKVKNAVDKLGGMSQFVKKGAKVVIKPNGAWACPPEPCEQPIHGNCFHTMSPRISPAARACASRSAGMSA